MHLWSDSPRLHKSNGCLCLSGPHFVGLPGLAESHGGFFFQYSGPKLAHPKLSMHACLTRHGQSLRELHSVLVELLPRGTNAALQRLVAQQDVNLHKQRWFALASDRDRQGQRVPDPKAQDLESLSRGEGGGYGGGGGPL